ncbi:MAG: right-handed parallel beta-helix repeat-containing protein [Methanobrevibacter sp.]|nr:right-handed parallel beta-helix repeat-containing protein [Methanobrevibacter sp.]
MNKIKIFLILAILFLSISAVSAEGNFTALQNEIDSSDNSIDIQQDYKYDSTADNGLESGILINKSNFIINGNDHTIDGANQARIFNVSGENITILNLNLINGNADNGAAISIESHNSLTINNVRFINNHAAGNGAVYGDDSSQIISNCYFENNTAKFGGSIYSQDTETQIINSTFINSTSQYGPAIYHFGTVFDIRICEITIQDCIFKNLHAEESAGAIGLKKIRNIKINNCTFMNTTSSKNGGAVYIDFRDIKSAGSAEIKKSRFLNSTGDYGGAIVQLLGQLNLEDCEFCDNAALYRGGAIYLSGLEEATINNTNIYRNKLQYNDSYGGGLYSDYSNTNIENCEFINNTRQGIYAYDKKLNVENTLFSNNGEDIHGVFTECNLTNNTFVENKTLCLNDTNYASNVHEIAESISLINNTINVETLPSKYDSRDWGWVSSVKDQGPMGACWTFGTCGALESALLKATGIEYDFSENNMQSSMLQYSRYGIETATEGGKVKEQGLEYILSWFGVMPSEYDTFDELGKLSPLMYGNEKIHVFDAIFVGSRKNATDNDELKKAILRCGSVVGGFYYWPDDNYFNETTSAYYQTETPITDHMVSFIGWDDNYPASNFKITPPGDGAFILKNSHGTEFGEDGFLYISYYDQSVLNNTIAIGFIIENTENYTTNYQTDLGGKLNIISDDGNIMRYKNIYEANSTESISAVGTYFEADENYTLEIYVNDELVHTQSGASPFYGYHTVKLTKEIPITTGDNFTALMKKTSVPTFSRSRQHYLENVSFMDSGDGWEDLAAQLETVSLKVYTKDLAIYTEDLVKIYKNESKFVAEIDDACVNVTFEINGKNYTRISDENGTASMAINLGPGNYTIKTTYNNATVENTITVLPTLIAENLVKYYRNESQFFIDLIDSEGNPVNGTNITMNINGVFYNRETNENGTARLNINLIPGEYILTAIDPLTGLQMSYNITVLPVLTAEDMEMTYKDGSQFTAKVVDGQGKALANAKVTFNINGVLYHKTTDENGTAKLNINLMAGEYIITSQYGQATISNKITITA